MNTVRSVFIVVVLIWLQESCGGRGAPLERVLSKVSDTKSVIRSDSAPGNSIIRWINYCPDSVKNCGAYVDPVDDTITYKLVSGRVYTDTANNAFVLSMYQDPKSLESDISLFVEYYQGVSDEIDLRSYRVISGDYITTKGKVYLWWGDMQHYYLVAVQDADPKTFKPFDKIAGGTDKHHVFYGGPPHEFDIIPGADPRSIRILNPKRGCWNCGNCYFADDRSVFFGTQRINGADAKSFKLVDKDSVDAQDKNHRYFDGKVVK